MRDRRTFRKGLAVAPRSNVVSLAARDRRGLEPFAPMDLEFDGSNTTWADTHLPTVRLAVKLVGLSREGVAAVVDFTPDAMSELIESFDSTGRHMAGLVEVLTIARERLAAVILSAAGVPLRGDGA